MSSNFNTNRRTQEYNFKSKVFDEYPISNLNSMNYDDNNGWPENSPVTPRMSTMRRLDTQSMRSSNVNDSASKSKDEFTIFGSFVRQKSERKSTISTPDRSKTISRQFTNFNNLPVKSSQNSDFATSEYSTIIKRESTSNQQSQPKYSYQTELQPNSLFDLIQTNNATDRGSMSSNPYNMVEDKIRESVSEEPIMAQRKMKAENAVPMESIPSQLSQDDSSQTKNKEFAKLQKSIDNKNKMIEKLKDNDAKLRNDIKNLLDERKQLLNQIQNSEFEEIIEEEEVQEAKPNYTVREVQKPVEVSHANCLQKGNINLDDVPQRLLDSYRNELINQVTLQKESEQKATIELLKQQQQRKISDLQAEYSELQKVSIQKSRMTFEDIPQLMLESYREQITKNVRDQMEIENRSLMETLKIQQQKKLTDLQAQYETVQRVSVQTVKKTRYNHIVTDTNTEHLASLKPRSSSVGVHVFPTAVNKQIQYEIDENNIALKQYLAKNSLSSWQKSVLEKVLSAADTKNFEGLLATIEQSLYKSSTSIGINNTPTNVVRSTNTTKISSFDVSSEFIAPVDVEKKVVVVQESRAVMVKPVLLQRGCQPEDTFKFETGTMTDQIFCRSQGMMTVNDYPDHKSPLNIDQESTVNRSRSEMRKQTIMQTTYMNSPTKDFANQHQERSLSPRIIKPVQKNPETVVEDIVEIKTFKVESKPKPVNVIEEVKHVVEETTQQVTSVLDQNKVPKPEIPTTIECWETISHLKDGEVIDKTETYHDQLVSTDIQKIKEHLDRFNSTHPTELSPTLKLNNDSVMQFEDSSIISKSTTSKSIPVVRLPSQNDAQISTKVKDVTSAPKSSTSSENSPVIKEKNFLPNFRKSSIKKENYSESENSFVSSISKKPSDIKEIKVQNNSSMSKQKESTSQKLEHITGLKKPINSKDIKVERKIEPRTKVDENVKESVEIVIVNDPKKPVESKELNVEKKSYLPTIERTVYRESAKTAIPNKPKESSEVREIKVEESVNRPNIEKTLYQESEQIIKISGKNESSESNEGNIEKTVPMPEVEKTLYHESESIVNFSIKKEPKISEDFTIVKPLSKPIIEKTTYHEFEQTISSKNITESNPIKDINVQHTFTKPSLNETIHGESEHSSSSITRPIGFKEVRQNFASPINQRTIFQESEKVNSSKSSNKSTKDIEINETPNLESEYTTVIIGSRNPGVFKEIKVQSSLNNTIPSSHETTYFKTEQTSSFNMPNKAAEFENIKVHQNFSLPSTVRETTYEETEKTVTYTNTTSTIPMSFESASNLVQSRIPTSISILTSPKPFQPPPSTKARSTFSSSKTENYSFESDNKASKSQVIPIQISTGVNIPVNEMSKTTQSKVTNVPVIVSGSNSIASSNSAFHSPYSSKDQNKTNQFSTDVSEILLTENIFKSCTELLLWLKSTNLVTTSTITLLPSNLVSVSATLIDWWVNITVHMDSSKLLATVQYLITTFSKNLLKYFIINLDQQGNTCLHYIIGNELWDSFGVLESTKLVDPNIYNSQGYTVLMVACTTAVTIDMARDNLRRLALSANVNLTSKYQGQTALFIAALHNNSYMIQMLYTLGADVNIRDNDDNTPLMIACSKNHIDSVTTIMSWSGVLIDLKNKAGKTALDIAQESDFGDLLEIFKQRKSTRASEISSYSEILQKTYSNRSYTGRKY